MGVTERKAKEKEDLKALILKGAKKLFVEKGIEATTIRNIADAIEYSVGTVYVYYKDKNAILHDLHSQGFAQLGGDMRLLFHVSNPMERLKAIGRIYIKFALENPDMYDLMFNLKAPMEFLNARKEEEWNEGKAAFAALQRTVEECMDAGHFQGHNVAPLAFVIWGAAHGMCSLLIRDRVRGVVSQCAPEVLIEDAYESFVKIIETQ